MNWSFVLPGQPPSWNHSYTIVTKHRYNASANRIPYSSMALKQSVRDYQDAAIWTIKVATPRKWRPTGFIRTYFSFYLVKDIDCDNILKSVHDAMKKATDVDDNVYLPVVVKKEYGWKKSEARVEVVVEDPASLLSAPRTLSTTPTR